MRQFKAILNFPEGSIDEEMLLAVYPEDMTEGSLGHCTVTPESNRIVGSFELTDNVNERSQLRIMGYVDASNGVFIPERLIITAKPDEEEDTMPISALILDDVTEG